MASTRKKIIWFSAVAIVVTIVDQWSKFVVRTTPDLHRLTIIEGWLQFNYTKNPGMAMGITWLDTWLISIIAMIATTVIIGYVLYIRERANLGFMIFMGMIVGGAVGNILDRLYMAIIGGYGGILDGHVVDFIHFKLEIGSWTVFPYIFNVADVFISIAIVALLLFGNYLLPPDPPKKTEEKTPEPELETEQGIQEVEPSKDEIKEIKEDVEKAEQTDKDDTPLKS